MPPRAKVVEPEEEIGPAWAERLIGHAAAEQAFLKAHESGRMPHAWLISGPKGVGKATLAYRMARFLLAQPIEAEPAGMFGDAEPAPTSLQMPKQAPVFRQVAQKAHPDFRLLAPGFTDKGKQSKVIGVDDVRVIKEFLHLKAANRWRVVIVDSANHLNRSSANALLKSLEEPMPNTVLLLLSDAPQSLLPTIRSRCRKLPLQPLEDAVIAAELGARNPKLSAADRQVAALTAAGSLGQALAMVEADGIGLLRELGALLSGWPRLDAGLLHKLGDKLAGRDQGPQFELAVGLLGWWFARMARAAATEIAPNPEVFQGEAALIGRMRAAASLDRWLAVWEKVSRLFDRVQSVNLDRKQAWVAGFLAIEGAGR